jgi:hypothetical protein
MENILAYRIKNYLIGCNIKIKFDLNSDLNKITISVFLPNSDVCYSWFSFDDFLLGDYSVFGNPVFKQLIPGFNYLISDSFEELAMKMDLMGI